MTAHLVEIRTDGRAYVITPDGRSARNRAGQPLAFHDHQTAREVCASLNRKDI